MEHENIIDTVKSQEQDVSIQPTTFAERLREGAINLAKNFCGVPLRLATYTLVFSIEGIALESVGVSMDTALTITAGSMFATMVVGEVYFMNRNRRD